MLMQFLLSYQCEPKVCYIQYTGKPPADGCSTGHIWDSVCSGHFALKNFIMWYFLKTIKN